MSCLFDGVEAPMDYSCTWSVTPRAVACAAIVVTGTMYQKPAAGRMLLRLAEAIVLCIVEAVQPVTSHAEAR